MNCPICNGEMRIATEQVGIDNDNIPIFHRFAYCDVCRKKKDLDVKEDEIPQSKKCPKCGSIVDYHSNFCNSCGFTFISKPQNTQYAQNNQAAPNAVNNQLIKTSNNSGQYNYVPQQQPKKDTSPLVAVLGGIIFICILMAVFKTKEIQMPDYVGDEYEASETNLKDRIKVSVKTEYDYDDEVEKDKVIRTVPAYGETVKEKTDVTFVVSKGARKIMPNIIGMSVEEANNVLAKIGVTANPEYEQEYSDTIPKGNIVSAEYETGTEMDDYTEDIYVKLSRGTRQDEIDYIIAEAQEVTYDDLMRYPDTYQDKPIKLTVKVTKTDIKSILGIEYATAFWATCQKETLIVEDIRKLKEPTLIVGDKATIYGYGNGLTTIDVKQKEYQGSLLIGFSYNKTVDKYQVPDIKIEHAEIN